jgi:hypothetical protein
MKLGYEKDKRETKRIKGHHMRCLRSLSGATLQNKVPNEKTKGSIAKCEYAPRCR